MADLIASERVYHFEELLSGYWNWRLLQRQLPEGMLKITRIKEFSAAAVVSCLQAAGLATQFVLILRSKPLDWDIVMEATALLLSILMAVCQGIVLLLKRRVLERLMANLELLFPQTRAEQESCNLETYANEVIRSKNLIDKLCRFSATAFIVLPVVFSIYEWLVLDKDFPFYYQFRSWYPVNAQSWTFYPFLYIFEICVSLLYGFYLLNDYVFHAVATSQMRMHYWHLGRLLSELDATTECSKLGRLVDYHSGLDRLRDDVNDLFSVTTFITFSLAKLAMCLLMYTLLHGKNLMVLPTLAAVFILLILLVYARCSNGSALYAASEELVNKVYESNWYDGTPSCRRMLALIMARANNPVELHALRIQKIRMETFKEFIMEAYQIFTLLLNFSEH